MVDHVIHLSIVTPQTTAYAGDILAVAVPGSKAPFQILFNHAPIISSLDIGTLKVEDTKNVVTYYASKEGFVEVLKNKVSIIVNELVSSHDVDTAAAEADLQAARRRSESPERAQREQARKDITWAEARLRAVRLQREHA